MKFLSDAYGILPVEKPEVVNDMPVNTWLNEGAFIYRLQLTGGYCHGVPNVSNDFSMCVQSFYRMTTEEQACDMGAHIADLLRQDQFRQALCNLQAVGRYFRIKHTTRGQFYTVHGWTSRVEALRYKCAIEVLRALEDIQHYQLIDRGLLEVCMTDIPANVINPVNVEGKPFVVLKSLYSEGVCITSCKKDQNVAILANGRLAYDVVAFCDSYEDAQPIWEKALYK